MTLDDLLTVIPCDTWIEVTDADTNEVYDVGCMCQNLGEQFWEYKIHEIDPKVSPSDGKPWLDVFVVKPE